MQALILAGGKGTRLMPYTANLPKPLMPIDNMPILEVIVKQLKFFGVKSIIMAVGHLHHMIESYFKDSNTMNKTLKILFFYFIIIVINCCEFTIGQ